MEDGHGNRCVRAAVLRRGHPAALGERARRARPDRHGPDHSACGTGADAPVPALPVAQVGRHHGAGPDGLAGPLAPDPPAAASPGQDAGAGARGGLDGARPAVPAPRRAASDRLGGGVAVAVQHPDGALRPRALAAPSPCRVRPEPDGGGGLPQADACLRGVAADGAAHPPRGSRPAPPLIIHDDVLRRMLPARAPSARSGSLESNP